MCVPACHDQIVRTISRRSFLRRGSLVAATGLVAGCAAPVAESETPSGKTIRFDRIVDLTHTLRQDFPTYFGPSQLSIETLFHAETDGFNLNQWTVNEHTGTHMDAPFHFNGSQSADLIPVDRLVGPLAVIDIRARAADNPDAQVTPDDIRAWEAAHGPLPAGAIVAMNSGWDAHVMDSDRFRNADADGTMHFPGFHIEVADFLLAERDVSGVMVDTLSLDHGPSPDFAFHFRWLPADHWGIEGAANLSELPASGATVVVGGPKIQGATGGPSRIIAFV
ncbi:MAG: kynurenine formamidase [Rhodothermales bacterium]|jgi:kynurenine formamidase